MKKAITILSLAAMMALAGCGGDGKEPSCKIDRDRKVYTVCVGGYQFAIYSGYKQGGIVQVWENGPNGPRPMECTQGVK